MSLIERFLAEQPFFSGLDEEFIGFLAACAKECRFSENQILIRHGDPARSFYLIRNGRISREVPAIHGPPLIMHSIGGGEILGWSWLIPPYQWSFHARAQEPTEAVEFDAGTVLARCGEDPRFGYELLKRFSSLMSERLTSARQKMMDEWNPPGFG